MMIIMLQLKGLEQDVDNSIYMSFASHYRKMISISGSIIWQNFTHYFPLYLVAVF